MKDMILAMDDNETVISAFWNRNTVHARVRILGN
jgi:hypothetical protein